MLVKIVSFFLIGMVVLAMFGRFRVPGMGGKKLLSRKKCASCGAPKVGRGPCPCAGIGHKGGPGGA